MGVLGEEHAKRCTCSICHPMTKDRTMEEGPGGIRWRKVFRVLPVRFSHGPDGYLRGLPGSLRDERLPAKSRWFSVVEKAAEPYSAYYRPPAYNPQGAKDERASKS